MELDLDGYAVMAASFPDHPLGPQMAKIVENARHLCETQAKRQGELRRALAWMAGDDTGRSSQVLCVTMLGGRVPTPWHPWDPADLGRCLRLLDLMPEWRCRIGEMAVLSPQWAAIVGALSELEGLYCEEKPSGTAPRCYKRMRDLLESANRS